jgi:hypothetical protein
MSRQLMILADEGEAEAEDNGCLVLYSRVRDCAYALRVHAESERAAHKERGVWEEPDASGSQESDPDDTQKRRRQQAGHDASEEAGGA